MGSSVRVGVGLGAVVLVAVGAGVSEGVGAGVSLGCDVWVGVGGGVWLGVGVSRGLVVLKPRHGHTAVGVDVRVGLGVKVGLGVRPRRTPPACAALSAGVACLAVAASRGSRLVGSTGWHEQRQREASTLAKRTASSLCPFQNPMNAPQTPDAALSITLQAGPSGIGTRLLRALAPILVTSIRSCRTGASQGHGAGRASEGGR